MKVNNIWSQGQLFAFSALDGENRATDNLIGILSGDKPAIRFYTNVKRELMIVSRTRCGFTPEIVTSDYIKLKYRNATAEIIFATANLIIGNTDSTLYPIVNTEGAFHRRVENGVIIDDTGDGDFTALCVLENRFSFAYGKSEEQAICLAKQGLKINIEQEKEKKLNFYKLHSLDDDNKYARLYNKCLSTMKTQLYSPQGYIKRIWSTPDRLPHRKSWLWDSVFHAIGFRNIDSSLAENLILTLFDIQNDDGFIPHCFYVDYKSTVTQPPVIAWGSYLVFEKSKNTQFLEKVFESNKKFLLWCRESRRLSQKELYTWNTQSDVNCRCDESGMDNSPRFDTQERLFAIDFSCFMANETRYMQKIANIIGYTSEAEYFKNWHNAIKADINETLWCDDDGFYYDVAIEKKSFHKVCSVASFLPLFSGVCDGFKAQKLLNELKNPETFYTSFPIPSISKKDALFGSDMWRGPVWINYNYMIASGLKEYGYTEFSDEIISKTIDTLSHWYERKGTIYEFYDSENIKAPNELNRKGLPFEPYDFMIKMQTIREYGWSNTLMFDMLHNKFINK